MALSDAHGSRKQAEGLEIEEDLRHQRQMWMVERIGWGVIAAILTAATGGLFGHGLLSQGTLAPTSALRAEYERFARAHSTLTLRISHAGRTPAGTVSIWLPADYLAEVEVGPITPEPDRAELASGGISYHFTTREGPLAIVFRFKAIRIGPLSGSFRFNDEPPVRFRQFVYP